MCGEISANLSGNLFGMSGMQECNISHRTVTRCAHAHRKCAYTQCMMASYNLFKDISTLAQMLTGISAVSCVLCSFCVVDLACSWPDLGSCFWLVASSWRFGSAFDLVPLYQPVGDPDYSCDHVSVSDPGFPSYLSACLAVCYTSSALLRGPVLSLVGALTSHMSWTCSGSGIPL